jgi:hypothetical protein
MVDESCVVLPFVPKDRLKQRSALGNEMVGKEHRLISVAFSRYQTVFSGGGF